MAYGTAMKTSSNRDGVGALQAESVASDAVDFDPKTGIFRTEFDTHSRPPSEAVVNTVFTVTGTDPLDLPPLHDVIDPDALNELFAPTLAGPSRSGGTVTFEFAGYRVTVKGHGVVEIEADDDA